MVQLQSTVLVQIFSTQGQSSSPGNEGVRLEVRAVVDDGRTKTACQTIMNRSADGQYTVGMRAGIQTAVAGPSTEKMVGARIDRYA